VGESDLRSEGRTKTSVGGGNVGLERERKGGAKTKGGIAINGGAGERGGSKKGMGKNPGMS